MYGFNVIVLQNILQNMRLLQNNNYRKILILQNMRSLEGCLNFRQFSLMRNLCFSEKLQ